MNYIGRHWRGELSLSVSFWINGVVVSVLFGMVDNIVDKLVKLTMLVLLWPLQDPTLYNSLVSAAAWLLSAIVVWLAVTIWQMVGIWRSATRYRGAPTHEWPWGSVAKFMVVIGAVAVMARTAQVGIQISGQPTSYVVFIRR
jgi:hypothetical protein